MAAIDFTDKNTLRRNRPIRRSGGKTRFPLIRLVLGLAALGALAWGFTAFASFSGAPHPGPAAGRTAAARLADYRRAVADLERERVRLGAAWRDARGRAGRQRVLAEASAVFFPAVEHNLIPGWYGTGYGFNGATETPGVGEIACGFFVSTVLRDAGLRLDRVSLGQSPAESIIRSLVGESGIRRYSGRSGPEFLARLAEAPRGFYLLGLDKHVGFLSLTDSGAFFIHATLLPPYSVVREPAAGSRALMRSEYRVLGDLTHDGALLVKWLGGDNIKTRE